MIQGSCSGHPAILWRQLQPHRTSFSPCPHVVCKVGQSHFRRSAYCTQELDLGLTPLSLLEPSCKHLNPKKGPSRVPGAPSCTWERRYSGVVVLHDPVNKYNMLHTDCLHYSNSRPTIICSASKLVTEPRSALRSMPPETSETLQVITMILKVALHHYFLPRLPHSGYQFPGLWVHRMR